MAIRSKELKEFWEDETLEHFFHAIESAGGSQYELVERRDRPDRVIKEAGSGKRIGVEVTRIVEGPDAKGRRRVLQLGDAMRNVLGQHASGGRVTLYRGRFPDLSVEGRNRLGDALDSEITRSGGLTEFVATLPGGMWRYEDAVFHFSAVGKLER